jgi:predicted nuclease of predicted toxin-antitoxin system
MIIWIDAHLSPAIALWINKTFAGIDAKSLRSLGLRDSTDLDIFNKGKEAGAVLMTKDSDFINLLQKYGPPPQVIWLTFGNTSNK